MGGRGRRAPRVRVRPRPGRVGRRVRRRVRWLAPIRRCCHAACARSPRRASHPEPLHRAVSTAASRDWRGIVAHTRHAPGAPPGRAPGRRCPYVADEAMPTRPGNAGYWDARRPPCPAPFLPCHRDRPPDPTAMTRPRVVAVAVVQEDEPGRARRPLRCDLVGRCRTAVARVGRRRAHPGVGGPVAMPARRQVAVLSRVRRDRLVARRTGRDPAALSDGADDGCGEEGGGPRVEGRQAARSAASGMPPPRRRRSLRSSAVHRHPMAGSA